MTNRIFVLMLSSFCCWDEILWSTIKAIPLNFSSSYSSDGARVLFSYLKFSTIWDGSSVRCVSLTWNWLKFIFQISAWSFLVQFNQSKVYFEVIIHYIQGWTLLLFDIGLFYAKEIKKNTPDCIVEICKHAGIFKNTRKVRRESRGAAECTSRVFLKIHKCLFNSTLHEDKVFYLFYKMLKKLRVPKLVG